MYGTRGVGYLIASHFIDMRRRLDKEGKVRLVIVHRLMSFVVSTVIMRILFLVILFILFKSLVVMAVHI